MARSKNWKVWREKNGVEEMVETSDEKEGIENVDDIKPLLQCSLRHFDSDECEDINDEDTNITTTENKHTYENIKQRIPPEHELEVDEGTREPPEEQLEEEDDATEELKEDNVN